MSVGNSIRLASQVLVVSLLLLSGSPAGINVLAGQKGRARASTTTKQYSCPMHPTVKSRTRGKCPLCGMALKPVTESAASKAAQVNTPATHDSETSKMKIPDVELLDQDGRKVRFYTDLVKDKLVVINFIFTTCTTICPPLGATFARLQKEYGERVGRDIFFISVSVDPTTDTPERLKAWGAKFRAGPGWTFVTGEKSRIDELLRALSAATAQREDHTPILLIGNEARGTWIRTYGLTPPSQLVRIIDDAAASRVESTYEGSTP